MRSGFFQRCLILYKAARKDNLCRLAPGLRRRGAPGAGKVRVHAWRRRRATPGSGWTYTEHQTSRKGKRRIRAYALRHHGSRCAFDPKANRFAVRRRNGHILDVYAARMSSYQLAKSSLKA